MRPSDTCDVAQPAPASSEAAYCTVQSFLQLSLVSSVGPSGPTQLSLGTAEYHATPTRPASPAIIQGKRFECAVPGSTRTGAVHCAASRGEAIRVTYTPPFGAVGSPVQPT